ncbi:hypothetical protein [Spirosoma horti]
MDRRSGLKFYRPQEVHLSGWSGAYRPDRNRVDVRRTSMKLIANANVTVGQ